MYAVIFKAEFCELDELYEKTAKRMRELALNEYGCVEFTSCTQGNNEIAVSYWNNRSDILNWKNNEEHQKARHMGKTKWYKHYQVQIVEVLNEYGRAKS